MGIKLEWESEERRIIVATFTSPWTLTELDSAIPRMSEMLNEATQKVDIIFDIRHAGFPPQGALGRFKKAADTDHPNGGKLVYVAPMFLAGFIRTMVEILSRFYGSSFTPPAFEFVSTLEEAHTLLSKKAESPVTPA